jgi:putative MATE family efflux protein
LTPDAPAWRRILRLALPVMVVSLAQAAAQTVEVYLIGFLGTGALASYALVLPLVLLLQMTSVGAMGGGVVSAVARALGAGRTEEAGRLAVHALLIGIFMGLLFTLGVLGFGRSLFVLVGGRGAVLEGAVAYAEVLFLGAVPAWIANTLSAVLRGTGNTLLPSRVMLVAWVVQPLLSALLMFEAGLGLRGAGIAYALVFVVAAVAMAVAFLRDDRLSVPWGARLSGELFWRILAVGAVASLMATIANVTGILVTAVVAPFGDAAIAAFGIGVRLEFLQIPLAFGIGAALTTMCGMAAGRGDWAMARRLAWTGAAMAGGLTGLAGILLALFPTGAAGVFAADAAVAASLATYLRIVGPCFGLFGAGMALYFASQGVARMRLPFVASVARCALGAGLGALLAQKFGVAGAFAGVAMGISAYGLIVASAVRPGVWGR